MSATGFFLLGFLIYEFSNPIPPPCILEFQAKKLSFAIHPSQELVRLFSTKPFQGADPEFASLVFVGLDANYSAGIATEPIFPSILEYHADGPRF